MRIMCERVGICRQINNHTNKRVSRCIKVSEAHCEKVFSGDDDEGEENGFASVFLSLFTSYLPYAKDPPQLCLGLEKRGRKVVQCYSPVFEPIADRSKSHNEEEATSDHGRRLLLE